MSKAVNSATIQDTSSLSFIRSDSFIEEAQKTPIVSNLKERFNPNSTNLKMRIPRQIERVFKGVETIEYIYDFVDSKHIEIVDLRYEAVLHRIRTVEYGELDFNITTDKLIFVFGKETFRTRQKSEQAKKYKESLAQGKKFLESNLFKDLRSTYFNYQIEHGINFVYIENAQDLHMQLKALISIQKDDGGYVPKTGKFSENEKSEYLINLLATIPGVSQETSRAITSKFSSMASLLHGLLDKRLFTSIRVGDESGGWRNVTEKVYMKIYKALYSENEDEKF